jgi:GPH family glycoside/pentoside/hexuronide:cation symporter
MNEQPEQPRLTLMRAIAYGLGDLGTAMAANILVFFLLPFFTTVAGIPAGLAGSLILIGKVWDAINDPLIGMLSDRTHHPFGRRRIWMAWGSAPLALSFILLWWIPLPGWGLWLYYAIALLLFHTFYTAVNLPYAALMPELSHDYDERTSLTNIRFAFSIAGSLISGILFLPVVNLWSPDRAAGHLGGGILWALLGLSSLWICILATPEPPRPPQISPPIWQEIRTVFANPSYRYVVGIYLCAWLGVQFTASIIPFFITYWMGLPDIWISYVILAVQGTAFVMLFVWNRLCRITDKKIVYLLGMGLWLIAQGGLFLVQPGETPLMLVLAILAGMGVSVAYLIPWAMIPDVIDADELVTGQRREGVYYAFMVFLQKLGLALGLQGIGWILEGAGFISSIAAEAPPVQPDSALWAIRLAIGPIPALALSLGMILAVFYPLSRRRHAEIRQALANRPMP